MTDAPQFDEKDWLTGDTLDAETTQLVRLVNTNLRLAAELTALRAERDAAVALLERWQGIAQHCSITDGCCGCGESIENHSDPMSCGHAPTDYGTYVADGALKDTIAFLAALSTPTEGTAT